MGEQEKGLQKSAGDARAAGENLRLQLFVTGASPNSERAIINLKQICETYISGQYFLEIIDVYQQPDLARLEQIVALPLLVRRFPLPERRLIGDLSDTKKVLRGLGLKT